MKVFMKILKLIIFINALFVAQVFAQVSSIPLFRRFNNNIQMFCNVRNRNFMISVPIIANTTVINAENNKIEDRTRSSSINASDISSLNIREDDDYLFRGENLLAVSVYLANNYDAAAGMNIVGVVRNDGTSIQNNVVIQFFLGNPNGGGTQIGSDLIIPSLPPSSTVYDSVIWNGFTGSSHIYFVVDPYDSIAEDNESDNMDSIFVSMRDSVPWVWQELDGFCHYASLSMIFNIHGANNTIYETIELGCCPHSIIYIDNWFYVLGGVNVCQGESDFEFAGEIRNLSCDFEVAQSWQSYMTELKNRINIGLPTETSVDPYYMPQEDYDTLRVLGIHSSHGIVVVGYTDSSIIVNDPGVGIFGIPNPENRGSEVIIDLDTFKLAVEGPVTPYCLLSYTAIGPMPSNEEMLYQSLAKSIDRLSGDSTAFDTTWLNPPPGWQPAYGAPAFAVMKKDMNLQAFQVIFDSAMIWAGGNLIDAINILGSMFITGMYYCQIDWDASAHYYGTLSYPEAMTLSSLSNQLAVKGEEIWVIFNDMLIAIYNAGGNTSVAEPYLSQIESHLNEVMPLEDSVLFNLIALHEHLSVAEVANPEKPNIKLMCYPNPFVDKIIISFTPSPKDRIRIYDLSGRLVKFFDLPDHYELSTHIIWDGKDINGTDAQSGVYFLEVNSCKPLKVIKLK
jgi:hypothetical protein